MPQLFALGLSPALREAEQKLQEDESLFAFLDDLYLLASKPRVVEAFRTVADTVQRVSGIYTNLGKLQMYSRAGGTPPPGLAELELDAGDINELSEHTIWKGDATAPNRGIVVLGSPIGSFEFCKEFAEKRMVEENRLLAHIQELGDLQVSWLLLYMCAVPRANHLLRIVPPSMSKNYAFQHSASIFCTLEKLLRVENAVDNGVGRGMASIPQVMGGVWTPPTNAPRSVSNVNVPGR